MINLLPSTTKLEYRYARRNKHLLRWLTALLVGILGAVIMTGIGFLYLHQLTTSYGRQLETSKQQLKEQKLEQTNAAVKDMSNNLTLAVEVLSKQILFSELLKKLSTLLPANTILSGLSVSQTQGALDVTAKAKDYAAATQIQVNLSAKENGLFSKVDIVNISCTDTGRDEYPCTVSIRALFASNSQIAVTSKQSNTTGARP